MSQAVVRCGRDSGLHARVVSALWFSTDVDDDANALSRRERPCGICTAMNYTSQMTNKVTPVTLNLSPNNGVFTFSNWSDAKAWALAETNHWKRFKSIQSAAYRAYQAIGNVLTLEVANTSDWGGLWETHRTAIEKAYCGGRAVHRQSVRGQFIEKVREDYGEQVAAAVWAMFIGTALENVGEPNVLRGIALAISFENNTPPANVIPLNVLESTNQEFRSWFERVKSELSSEQLASVEARTSISDALARINTELEAIRAKAAAEYQESVVQSRVEQVQTISEGKAKLEIVLAESKVKLSSIEETFNEKLALASPVEYWRERRKRHRGLAWCFGIIASLLVIAAGLAIFSLLPSFFPAEVTLQTLPVGRMFATAAFVTLAVWVLRIAIRLFLMNLHIATDASEREVMVTTYLALLRENNAIKESDRSLVLEPLFRRCSTGIVKDDANPPLFLGQLQRRSE